ncbi:hypothetical protein HYC85_005768 [Camellia sinensis]|uniref:Uncharacterized protein n=1 Tax=Camellia sinensis TaxID=4442 RepID=A0A7J7I0F2_CAMSI|nr:hypothetical protein HYC85_005768 [Camellia sinensis]
MESARRIRLPASEGTRLTGSGSSWQVGRRAQAVEVAVRSLVPPVAATGTSTEGKWRLRQYLSLLDHLLHQNGN